MRQGQSRWVGLESVASAAEGSAAERRAPTFSYLVTQYFERHGPHKAEASLKQDRSLLRHIPKEWSGRLLTSFTRNEMSQLHSDIASKGTKVRGITVDSPRKENQPLTMCFDFSEHCLTAPSSGT